MRVFRRGKGQRPVQKTHKHSQALHPPPQQGEILTTATFPIGEGVDQYTNQPTITQREFIFQGGFDCSHQGHQDICTETDVPYSYPWADNHATAKSYLCNPCSFHFRQCVVCLKALAVRCPYHVEHPVSGFSAEGRLKILSCDGCKLLVVKHKRITEAVTRVIMCRVKGEAILTPTHRGASSYGPVRAPTLSSRQTRSRRAAASATTAAAVRHSTSASSSPISSPSNTPTSHATRRTRSSTAASKKKASVTFNEEEI